MLESSKFDCQILTKHNFVHCQHILTKFSESFHNILFYRPAKFHSIIFKIDWFIAKTKRVSVQLGHSVVYNWSSILIDLLVHMLWINLNHACMSNVYFTSKARKGRRPSKSIDYCTSRWAPHNYLRTLIMYHFHLLIKLLCWAHVYVHVT